MNKTTRDKIEIMQHFVDGGEIEMKTYKYKKDSCWVKVDECVVDLIWNWENNDYRKSLAKDNAPLAAATACLFRET